MPRALPCCAMDLKKLLAMRLPCLAGLLTPQAAVAALGYRKAAITGWYTDAGVKTLINTHIANGSAQDVLEANQAVFVAGFIAPAL